MNKTSSSYKSLFTNTPISKKVLSGFVLFFLLLVTVSFISVRGFSRMNQWIQSTHAVNEVLFEFYKARLHQNRTSIELDSAINENIDSLTNNINGIISDAQRRKLNPRTKDLLWQITQRIEEVKRNITIYQQIEDKRKWRLEDLNETKKKISTASYFTDNEIDKINKIELSKFQNLTTNLLIDINELMHYLPTYSSDSAISFRSKQLEKEVSKVLNKIYHYQQELSNPILIKRILAIKNNIKEFDLSIVRIRSLNSDVEKIRVNLINDALIIQQTAEEAGFMQFRNLKYIVSSKTFLLYLIMGCAVIIGSFLFFFYTQNIKKDESKKILAERELFKHKSLLDNIINKSNALIYLKDFDGKYTMVNENWKTTNGLSSEEVIGKSDLEIYDKEFAHEYILNDQKVIESGLSLQKEEKLETMGKIRTYLSNKFPIKDINGSPMAVCGILTEITPLKDMMNALEQSEKSYRNLVANVPGIVFKCASDSQHSMLFISHGIELILGQPASYFLNKKEAFFNSVHPDDQPIISQKLKHPIQNRLPYEIEYRVVDHNGDIKWLQEKGTPIESNEKNEVIIQGVIIDVTDQKKAIADVLHRDRFLTGISEAVKELIVKSNVDQALHKSLRYIGESAEFDQSFIFKNNFTTKNQFITSQLYLWQTDKIETTISQNLQNINFESLGASLYHTLNENKEIYLNSAYNDSHFKTLQILNLQSAYLFPVLVKDEFWGFLGFGFDSNKNIPSSNIALLKAFTATLGIAISKQNDTILLSEAKETAEAATHAKSDFLARMSHEIRTPMNAILGWSHIAIQKDYDSISLKEYIKKIETSSKSLLGIINDILDFSKIEAGKLSIENINFDLEKVFSELSGMVTHKAHEKNLEIVFAIGNTVPLNLIGDPLRLGQILVNLVNNAIKFTDQGEVIIEVDVRSKKNDKIELLFAIKDTGIGLTNQQASNLFESFSQADISTTRKYGGTGLGLSICKYLSELMGGEIWVESEPNKGSSFYFTSVFAKHEKQKKNELTVPQELRKMNVLVCDDNENSLAYLKQILESFCFTVTTATSGIQTINIFKETINNNPFQLIFMDWMMPDMDGLQTIKALKKIAKKDMPKTIIATSHSHEKLIMGVNKIKISGVVLKPFSYSDIFNSILKVMGKNPMQASLKQKDIGHYFNRLSNVKNIHILLVEDNETNQLIGKELLEMAGIRVSVAENGKKAIEMLDSYFKYDLILMDIQMPIMDGYKATKIIRKNQNLKNLPIIAMTANAIEGTKQKCLDSGMVDMVAKPIDPEILYKTIIKWIESEQTRIKPINTPVHSKDSFPEIEGLDIQEGLQRFIKKHDYYKRVLQRFYQDHLKFDTEITKSLQNNDRELVARQLHSFKGIIGTIAAKNIYHLSILTEKAYLNDSNEFEELLNTMKKELGLLMNALKNCKYLEIDSIIL